MERQESVRTEQEMVRMRGKDVSDGGHQNPGSGSGDNQKAEDGRKSTGGEVPGEEGMPGLEGGQPEGGSEQEILHQPRIIVESSCVSDSPV